MVSAETVKAITDTAETREEWMKMVISVYICRQYDIRAGELEIMSDSEKSVILGDCEELYEKMKGRVERAMETSLEEFRASRLKDTEIRKAFRLADRKNVC